MSEEEKKAIALLKEDIKSYQKEVETSKYKKDVKSFSKYVERYTTILNLIEKQAKEIEEFQLIKEVLESYGKNGVGEYSKRYLAEYQAIHHTAFYDFFPDPDEIYKKYYEQKKEIEKLKAGNKKLQKEKETYRNEIYGTRLVLKERDKEIEELKDNFNEYKSNCIPKDKIRHLLKTYNISTDLSKTRDLESCDIFVDDIIELLEEE